MPIDPETKKPYKPQIHNGAASVRTSDPLDLRERVRSAQDAIRNQRTNHLMGDMGPKGDESTMNYLASTMGMQGGTREYVKAYMRQFGFDEGDYTESHLSPQGVDAIRKMAMKNYGRLGQTGGVVEYSQPDVTGMSSTLGRISPSNLRRVDIGGVPYWQVLDQYDFNNEVEDIKNGHRQELMNHLMTKGPADYRSKKIIPSLLGLRYNVNFLVPVDPTKIADPTLVEAYRKKTSLGNNPAYQPATLGGRAKRWVEQTVMPSTIFGGVAE